MTSIAYTYGRDTIDVSAVEIVQCPTTPILQVRENGVTVGYVSVGEVLRVAHDKYNSDMFD